MDCYIPYPQAMSILANRLEATPEELAAWVWMGPKINGLNAYTNANELDPPPRFFYDTLCENEFDYISPLMACWFDADDIANFKPADRYITGTALIKRWEKLPHLQPKNFIQAKIEETRLYDHHPIYGGTQSLYPEDKFPPLESGLFLMSEIELIETEDFGPDFQPPLEQIDEPVTGLTYEKNISPLRKFQEMNGLRFEEITILVDPDRCSLLISARGIQQRAPFCAIGILKKTESSPNRQAEIFAAVIKNKFNPQGRGNIRALTRLSKSLRDAFGTKDTPFIHHSPQFKVSIPKDREAEKHARRRTVPYNDQVHSISDDYPDDFLRKNDPEYDPHNPTYSIENQY